MAQSLPAFAIGDISVRQLNGLYSLNDLHKASGGAAKHQPALFMRGGQTQALIAEITSSTDSQNLVFQTIVGKGKTQGTYACREVVIAYAAWINAAFHLKVIRVFLDAVAPQPTPYSVQPGQSLSAEQANWLRDFLTSCARTLESSQRGEFMVQGWSKLKSHFGCSYRNIAAHEWVEAASLLARHAAEWGIQRASTPQQPQPQQRAPVALLENSMAPIYDARRRTLRQAMVLLCNGRQTNMARRLGIGASYVSRMLSTGSYARGIGGDYAREIEQKLGLPALWLDDERNASATSIVSAQPCANDAVPESARRSKELRILLGGIERMAPVKDRELTEAIQLARSISLELANDLDALQHELASA